MAKNKCHGCVKLEEHIKLVKEIKKHSEEVDALKFQMSDEALQQMPDFQGRVCLRDTNLSCQYFDLVVV
jgi:antiviral helicase SKI2